MNYKQFSEHVKEILNHRPHYELDKYAIENTVNEDGSPCFTPKDILKRMQNSPFDNRLIIETDHERNRRINVVTDVSTVKEFLDKYYRPDRYTGRGAEYAAVLVKSHEDNCKRWGYDLISHHDSKTGEVVYFIPQ